MSRGQNSDSSYGSMGAVDEHVRLRISLADPLGDPEIPDVDFHADDGAAS